MEKDRSSDEKDQPPHRYISAARQSLLSTQINIIITMLIDIWSQKMNHKNKANK